MATTVTLANLADITYAQLGALTLTGDVAGSSNSGSIPTIIQPGVVTGAKIATNTITNTNFTQIANNVIKGNISGGVANVADVSLVNLVTNSFLAQMPANTIKGNNTGSTANALDLTVAQTNTLLGTVTTSTTAGGDLSGTYPNPTVAKINGTTLGTTTATSGNLLIGSGSQWVTNAMSGDTTITSSGAVTIGTNVVSNTKLAQMPANTIKGNNTGSTANASDLTASQVKAVLNSAPQITVYGSGTSTTYTVPAGALWLYVEVIGAGGGGGGSGVAATAGNGGAGGSSNFGGVTTNGGAATTGTGATPGAGGTVTGSITGATVLGITGGAGSGVETSLNSTTLTSPAGAASPYGGGGGGVFNTGGVSTNVPGAGGSGGGGSSTVNTIAGASGSAGGYAKIWITSSLAATYTVSAGIGGTAGTAGTSGFTGGQGGAGQVIVVAYFQ